MHLDADQLVIGDGRRLPLSPGEERLERGRNLSLMHTRCIFCTFILHTSSDEVGCVLLFPGSQGVQIKVIFKKQLGVLVKKDVDVLTVEVCCWLPVASPKATLT